MKNLKPWQWVVFVGLFIAAVVMVSNVFWFLSDIIIRIIGILLMVGLVFVGYTLIKNRKK